MRDKIISKKPNLTILINALALLICVALSQSANAQEDPAQYLRKGARLYEQGAYASALELFRQASNYKSSEVLGYINMSACLMQFDDDEEAIRVLKKAENLEPTNINIKYNLGLAYFKLDDNASAARAFQETIELSPDFADGLCGLAKVYEKQGLTQQARQMYNRAYSLYKKQEKTDMTLALEDYLPGIKEEVGETKAAEAASIKATPNSIDAIIQESGKCFQEGNYSESERLLIEALQLDPQMPSLHYRLGLVYIRQEQYEKAVDSLLQAIKLDEHYFKAYLNLGSAYGKLARYKESIEAINKAIKIEPSSAVAYFNLGKAYILEGKKEQSKKTLKKALVLSQDQGLDELSKQIEDLLARFPS